MVGLKKLVLVGATQDTVIYPWQSEQFGGYVTNSNPATVFTMREVRIHT